ncbi:MAG: DUF4265 domain-containing protein [Planctomycetota bacterium]
MNLSFALDVIDGWPPVSVECLLVESVGDRHRLLSPPLFVKGLSVGDVLCCQVDPVNGLVFEWSIVERSGHSTFWLARLRDTEAIAPALIALRVLGCHTVSADAVGVWSVDVPGDVPIEAVDAILDGLPELEVAIACPSSRH